MPIKSFVMGPGTLTFGAAGVQAVSAQVTKCTVKWDESVDKGEDLNVLSGEVLTGDVVATYAAKLEFEVIQGGETTGLVMWSWTNRGTTQNFVFTPNTALGRTATGTVRPVPLDFGGDVKKRNTSSTTWQCPTDPVMT